MELKKTKNSNKFNQFKFNKDEPPKKINRKKKNVVEKSLDTNLHEDKSNHTKQHLKNTSFNIYSFQSSKSKLNSDNKKTHKINNSIYKNAKNKKGIAILHTIKNEKLEKKINFKNKYNHTHSFKNNNLNSTKLKKIKIENISFLTEFELNLLEYNNALKIDKRRIFQFYWSFLKRANIIFYALIPYDDYNLRIIITDIIFFKFDYKRFFFQ